MVTQKIFLETDQVEIVISNNSSTDHTEAVALEVQGRFPDKVVYVRTGEVVHSSLNFANVLLHARGELCKLHNDSVSVQDGFLASVVDIIQKDSEKKRPIFFLNGNWQYHDETTSCTSVDDFVAHVSFYMTWIGGFSIRKDDISTYISSFQKYTNHFAQTEILLRMAQSRHGIVVYNKKFGEEYPGVTKPVDTKFINSVYIGEYIPILKHSIVDGELSVAIYKREMTKFLVCFYMPHYYRFAKKFSFSYIRDFFCLKKYVGYCKYCFSLFVYPLCVCLYKHRKNVTLRKTIAYFCNFYPRIFLKNV